MTGQPLHQDALDKSLEVREVCGFDFKTPISIFDTCERLGLSVRLINDVSMEGVYIGAGLHRPTIVISTLRPLSRRAFTCAHELGHHVFGDGVVLDAISDDHRAQRRDIKEVRADTFAGHLLMPMLGVAEAFTVRGWSPEMAAPEQVYAVACNFGVGFTTLVYHLQLALHLISERQAARLLRSSLLQIRTNLLGRQIRETLILADRHFNAAALDTEAGALLLVPEGVRPDDGLSFLPHSGEGTLLTAAKPGIFRAYIPETDWAILIRVSRPQYTGLARYRHLEEAEDD